MPLPDPAIQQQTELLREMRDEMRSIRAQGGGMGTSSADGLYRPPNTFVRGQLATDRIMSGEFANFGWSQAYSHLYRPSLMGDVMGALGFARAPASMTQAEFHEMAQQRLGAFPGELLTGVFAPGFRQRTNNLAADILANSPRFIRAGESSSAFGAGFRYQGARAMARDIQLEAIGDVRLSSDDYSTIVSTGMRGGQFDEVRNASEFMQRMRELAQATGNLTRILHMGASDVAQSMAQMRAVGITSLSQQEQSLIQATAAAQVAGIAPGQMLSATLSAAQRGLQYGFTGAQTMDLAAGNIASTRQMLRYGLMDPGMIAAGGGAINIAQQITQQQQQFVGSNAGLMAFIGQRAGTQGDFIGQMLGGLQGVAGQGFGGMLEVRMNRMNILANMTAQEQQDLFRQSIEQQVGLLGIEDVTSRRGQAAAFNVLVSQGMADPAAMAFVQTNFSPEGRRATAAANYNQMRAEDFIQRKMQDENYYLQNTFQGRWASARADILQTMARGARGAARWFETGQTGTLGMGSQLDYDYNRLTRGVMPADAGLGDRAFAVINDLRHPGASGFGTDDGMTFGRVTGPGGWGVGTSTVGALGGAWAGMKLGGWIGGWAGSALGPVGTAGGALVGSLVGAVAGSAIGYFTGAAAGSELFGGQTEAALEGKYMATAGREVVEALRSKTPTAKADKLLHKGVISKSPMLRDLVAGKAHRKLDAKESADLVRYVELATKELQYAGEDVSREDVVGVLRLTGVEIDSAEVTGMLGMSQTSALKTYKDMLKKILPGSANEIEGTLLSASTAGILQDYFGALESGDVDRMGIARGRLRDTGMTGEQIVALTDAFQKQGKDWRQRFTAAAGGAREAIAGAASAQGLGVFSKFARSVVASATGGQAGAARTQLEEILAGGNAASLIPELLEGESSLAQVLLSENAYIRGTVSKVRAEDFAKISAEDLSTKFGFSKEAARELINARTNREITGQELQRGVLGALLQDPMLEAQGVRENIERDTVAASLNNAAQILQDLVVKLKLGPAKTAEGAA